MPEAMKETERSFTVISSSFGRTGGRYVADDPATAGQHAARQLFRSAEKESRNKGSMSVTLTIREITRVAGAKNKEFTYTVTKEKKPASEIKVKVFPKKDGSKVEFTPRWNYVVKAA